MKKSHLKLFFLNNFCMASVISCFCCSKSMFNLKVFTSLFLCTDDNIVKTIPIHTDL